jgi:hypothetical protein
MKKIILLFLSVSISASFIPAQTIIENPEKPLSKNSGRLVKLIEMMQISDVGGKYYFEFPRNLKISPNGSIFIQDQGQFLQFDSDGRFVRNLFRTGQGPGEMQSMGNYFFHGDTIIVYEAWTKKILFFDIHGKFLKEFKIQTKTSLPRFLLFWDDISYFLSSERPPVKKTSVIDVHQKLIGVAQEGQEGEEIKEMTEFPTKGYIAIGRQGGRVFYDISSVIAVPYQKKFLFVSHTQEYLLKLYDVEKEEVTRIFKRDYQRVKTPKDAKREGGAMLDGKPILPPRQKFLNDVQNLLIFNKRLWVVTSTMDREKGTLIDVYDSEGQYADNFYLKLPENLVRRYHANPAMDISGDYLFTIEQNG